MSSALMVIAHRGASSYAPENTFAAFDLALRMGACHVELDVDATSDGHIVVIHDDTLDRTTSGSGQAPDGEGRVPRRPEGAVWSGPGLEIPPSVFGGMNVAVRPARGIG